MGPQTMITGYINGTDDVINDGTGMGFEMDPMSLVYINNRRADSLVPVFHVICWCLPAIITIVATAMDVFGFDKNITTASWCWISPNVRYQLFWQLLTGKVWEVAAYVMIVILYTLIKYNLIRQMQRTRVLRGNREGDTSCNESVMLDANRKMTFVPAVFITVRIWGTLRFLLGAIDPVAASSVSWIAPLQGIGDSAQGFANCVLFCIFTERVRKRLLFCCRKRNKCTSETYSGTHILTENQSDTANKDMARNATSD
ncbi:unnamed protein product [Owenia fusiformis]|uniref:Uncharacterized protein n=1 Tax=Owenia fusiformis TaxID=6347 RepID=A0A8J1XTH4_OWEFU|nr:unnamed protein product [Owenia fusiformis]